METQIGHWRDTDLPKLACQRLIPENSFLKSDLLQLNYSEEQLSSFHPEMDFHALYVAQLEVKIHPEYFD